MTVYKCRNCQTGVVALYRPKRCASCGSGDVWLEAECEVSLPGLEKAAAEREEARARAEADRLGARMRQPRGDVSARAGRMERDSPLFFGTGENPTLF